MLKYIILQIIVIGVILLGIIFIRYSNNPATVFIGSCYIFYGSGLTAYLINDFRGHKKAVQLKQILLEGPEYLNILGYRWYDQAMILSMYEPHAIIQVLPNRKIIFNLGRKEYSDKLTRIEYEYIKLKVI